MASIFAPLAASTPPVDPRDVTPALLCAEVFRLHAETIRIKKPHVAIANLEKIMLATLELSARNGFHSTTTRDLAERCGLSIGAVYNHVESKETLLRMILSAVGYAVDVSVAPFDANEKEDPEKRLRGLIRRHVLLSENLQRWFYFAFLEVKAFDPQARAIAIQQELRTESLLAGAISAGMARDLFAKGNPEMLAGLIKPLLQDWYLKRWKYRERAINPLSFIEMVTQFAENALRGGHKTPESPIAQAAQES